MTALAEAAAPHSHSAPVWQWTALTIAAVARAASRVERYAHPITGFVLILAGIYETLRNVFHVI